MPELDAERRERLAEVLRAHSYRPSLARGVQRCACGEVALGDPAWHRSHVADVLAPLVAGWLADAWDTGWHQAEESWGHEEPTAVNPYRGGDDG